MRSCYVNDTIGEGGGSSFLTWTNMGAIRRVRVSVTHSRIYVNRAGTGAAAFCVLASSQSGGSVEWSVMSAINSTILVTTTKASSNSALGSACVMAIMGSQVWDVRDTELSADESTSLLAESTAAASGGAAVLAVASTLAAPVTVARVAIRVASACRLRAAGRGDVIAAAGFSFMGPATITLTNVSVLITGQSLVNASGANGISSGAIVQLLVIDVTSAQTMRLVNVSLRAEEGSTVVSATISSLLLGVLSSLGVSMYGGATSECVMLRSRFACSGPTTQVTVTQAMKSKATSVMGLSVASLNNATAQLHASTITADGCYLSVAGGHSAISVMGLTALSSVNAAVVMSSSVISAARTILQVVTAPNASDAIIAPPSSASASVVAVVGVAVLGRTVASSATVADSRALVTDQSEVTVVAMDVVGLVGVSLQGVNPGALTITRSSFSAASHCHLTVAANGTVGVVAAVATTGSGTITLSLASFSVTLSELAIFANGSVVAVVGSSFATTISYGNAVILAGTNFSASKSRIRTSGLDGVVTLGVAVIAQQGFSGASLENVTMVAAATDAFSEGRCGVATLGLVHNTLYGFEMIKNTTIVATSGSRLRTVGSRGLNQLGPSSFTTAGARAAAVCIGIAADYAGLPNVAFNNYLDMSNITIAAQDDAIGSIDCGNATGACGLLAIVGLFQSAGYQSAKQFNILGTDSVALSLTCGRGVPPPLSTPPPPATAVNNHCKAACVAGTMGFVAMEVNVLLCHATITVTNETVIVAPNTTASSGLNDIVIVASQIHGGRECLAREPTLSGVVAWTSFVQCAQLGWGGPSAQNNVSGSTLVKRHALNTSRGREITVDGVNLAGLANSSSSLFPGMSLLLDEASQISGRWLPASLVVPLSAGREDERFLWSCPKLRVDDLIDMRRGPSTHSASRSLQTSHSVTVTLAPPPVADASQTKTAAATVTTGVAQQTTRSSVSPVAPTAFVPSSSAVGSMTTLAPLLPPTSAPGIATNDTSSTSAAERLAGLTTVASSAGIVVAAVAVVVNPVAAATATKATQTGRMLAMARGCNLPGQDELSIDDVAFVWARDRAMATSATIALLSTGLTILGSAVAALALGSRTRIPVAVFTAVLIYYGPNVVGLSAQVLSRRNSGVGSGGATDGGSSGGSSVQGLVAVAAGCAVVGLLLLAGGIVRWHWWRGASASSASSSSSAVATTTTTTDGLTEPTNEIKLSQRAAIAFSQLVEGAKNPEESAWRRLHGTIDLAGAIVGAALCSIRYTTDAGCRFSAIVIVVIYGAQLLYLVIVRPPEHPWELFWPLANVVGMMILAASAAAAVSGAAVSNSRFRQQDVVQATTEWIGLSLTALFYAEIVFEVVMALRKLVIQRCRRSLESSENAASHENGPTRTAVAASPFRHSTEGRSDVPLLLHPVTRESLEVCDSMPMADRAARNPLSSSATPKLRG